MIAGLLFLCLGFLIAVLYIDLTFDRTVPPERRDGHALRNEALDPVTVYYRHITRNPYALIAVMMSAIGSIVAEIIEGGVSSTVAWLSLLLIGACAAVAVVKVIPAAQRLARGDGETRLRAKNARSILSAHLLLLAGVMLLVVLQFIGMAGLA